MKKNTRKRYTTVCCEESVRNFVALEAIRTGQPQRKVLADMVMVYEKELKRSATKKKEETVELKTTNELLDAINKKIDQAIKNDSNAIAILKDHERRIGLPTFNKANRCESLLTSLVTLLQKLE